MFPRRGRFADQDWWKKGKQLGKNRNVKSTLSGASFTESSFVFCLGIERETFFLKLLRKSWTSKAVRVYFHEVAGNDVLLLSLTSGRHSL